MPAVRFVFALLSFIISTFVLYKVPSIFLWQLKVGATELGNWFALIPLLLILVGRRQSAIDTVSVVLSALAVLLFFSSSLRAMMFAGTATAKMNAVFPLPPGAAKVPGPFSFASIWGFSSPSGEPQTLEYNEYIGQTLSLDFYPAKGKSPAPCVVVVHGGGWDRGDRKEFDNFSRRMALRGMAVAALDYRLAPEAKWPAQGDDVRAAIGYLKGRADELGIMPDKFVLMGRSAGGQVAEAVATSGTVPELVGCIGLYAPADMNFAFKYANKKDILNSDRLLRQYLGGSPDEVQANYDSASAYLQVTGKTVPMLLIHGLNDDLVWYQQSQRMAERLKQNGVKHVYLPVPWATHALDYNHHGPGAQLTLWAVERFVLAVTQPAVR